MYFIAVAALMLVLPVTSVAIDFGIHRDASFLNLVGKWFTFWSVGVRLVIAALRQIIQPRYTAREILGLKATRHFWSCAARLRQLCNRRDRHL